MAIRSISQLKSWFKKGARPTAEQFSDWMDSFIHKDERISMASVEGLADQLNGKCPKDQAVIREEGKGLSTNDFTTTEKNKLFGLPGSVYSKAEVDNKVAVIAGGFVVSESEVEVGEFRVAGSAGEIAQPVYSKLTIAADLPMTAGETAEYLLSDEPLGCNLYFSLDSFVVSGGERMRSEMFISLYEITKVYVDDDYRTKAVIRCRETTNEALTAYINVRYIKPYAEKIELEIDCETVDAAAVTVVLPPLKYDKQMLVSFTTDDANASSFCRVWAGINGRPISNKFYHANQLEAGDIPDEIVDTTLPKTLGYTDGCGNERRFRHGVAIWPYCQANDRIMMDTTNPVDPTANNLYRFMTPYLQWGDVREMLKYGVSLYYHNIGTEIYGSDKIVGNVIAGLRADCERSIERVGRGIKVLARPDGNNTFTEAAAASGQILLTVAENSPAVDVLPYSDPKLFKMVAMRFFPNSSGGQTERDVVKAKFAEEYAKPKELRKWFHFCCHTATLEWVNLLLWFNDNYGKDGSDDIWFATVDEVYEYFYARNNTLIRKSTAGNKLRITAYIPKGQYFYYPEISLLVNGVGTVTGIESSDNVQGLAWGEHSNGVLVNVNTDATLAAMAEESTSRFEQTEKSVDRNDALYFVGQLKESLQTAFRERIEAVQPGSVTLLALGINAGATTTSSRVVAVLPTYNGMPTHYRIGEVADLSAETWIAYSGGEIAFTLSAEYGAKTVYMQLKNEQGESTVKNASISYQEATAEILLSGLTINGNSTITAGDTAQLSVAYTPANTTQTGVEWSSSDEAVATVSALGQVTALTAGTAVITARSTANPNISTAHNITINAVGSDKPAVMIANYSWSNYKVDHILDETAGKYLSISNHGNNEYVASDNKLYDMTTGAELAGWSRMSNDEKIAFCGLLTSLDNWGSASSANPDLSDLFATPLEYVYSNKYNATVYPVVGWNIPNGTYKVSILSSTTSADLSSNGHIKINNVEQSLPAISFQNNKQWMEFDNIQVTEGKLAVMMYAEKSKRIGFNAIKIEKM